jgi:lipopolysaccharide biosynthesis regulator YciM
VAALALLFAAIAGLGVLLWRRWRRLDRSKAAGVYLRGFRYLLSGDPDGAIALLTKVASDGTLDAYFALGSLFRRKGELERAIQLHRNILLIPGLEATARTQALGELGRDFWQGALFAEAVEALEAACVDAAADDRIKVELRDCYLAAGRLEEAAAWQGRIYRGPRGHDDLGAHLWSELAERRLGDGEVDKAEEAVTYALEAAPRSLHARMVRAEVSGTNGSRRSARQDIFRLVEESPSVSAIALPWLWNLHEQTGALDELAMDFEEHFRALSLHPQAVLLQARLLRQQARLEEAAQELRRLLQASPGFLDARHELGQVLLSAGRTADFSAEYRSLLDALDSDTALGRCVHCGRSAKDVRWRCPACGAFDWFEDAWVQADRSIVRAVTGVGSAEPQKPPSVQ